MITLYHYVHVPYCVRVRMGMGFLVQAYESIVLPYHDEATPIKLTGLKMLPIAIIKDMAMNESLEILKSQDTHIQLSWNHLEEHQTEVDDLLDAFAGPVHSMAMPYWVWTPEFDQVSRKYFQNKKEVKRGPFSQLAKNSDHHKETLHNLLGPLFTQNLKPFYKSSTMTITDILIAAHLWGAYVVPEFQFEPGIHHYLQAVKKQCHFNYHEDFWKN